MSSNVASCIQQTISTMNSFQGSTGVNELKITCLGSMDFIEVNCRDGKNILQAKIFSTYIFLYYTGIKCTCHYSGDSSIGWYLIFKKKLLLDKELSASIKGIFNNRVRVNITNDSKIKFLFDTIVEDKIISNALAFNVLSSGRRIKFIKPVDALLIEGA